MSLQTSKKLCIFGVALIFLDTVLNAILTLNRLLSIGWNISTYGIIRIMGIICILISLHSLANICQTKTISSNAKKGAIIAIISIIIDIPISQVISNATAVNMLIGLLLFTIMNTGLLIIAAFYVEKSLSELATHTGITEFATAGKLLFIGAILTIILFGSIIMGVAFLILASAFLKIKNTKPMLSAATTEEAPPRTTATLNFVTNCYCPHCGASILPENVLCPHCGKHT